MTAPRRLKKRKKKRAKKIPNKDKAEIIQWSCARCGKRNVTVSFVEDRKALVCKHCHARADWKGDDWGPMYGGDAS